MDAETQNKQIPSLMAKDDMDCLVIPDSQLDASNPVIRLALVVTRIGQFYRAARRITSADSTSTPPNKQRELLVPVIQEALAIGAELAMIEKAMPTKLQPQQTADKRPTTPNNKSLVSFQSRWTACTWVFFNMYLILFFGRLHVCAATLLRLVDSKSSPQVQLAQTTATIAEKQVVSMTQRLCSVLPYLMGEVNEQGIPLPVPQRQSVVMYHLVWPLAIAIESPHSSPWQVKECQARLNLIRDLYGIRLASFAPGLARDLMA